jgi:hypothetical protein
MRLSSMRFRFGHAHRAGGRGQAMVEFALVAPLLFLMISLLVDFGRLVYTFSAMSNAAKDGARTLSLVPQANSDCLAIKRIESVSQAFRLVPDPASLIGNTDANSGGTPGPTPNNQIPAGQGYFYIWPAVAQKTPQDQPPNCDGLASPPQRPQGNSGIRDVQVQITYHFTPLSPIVGAFIPGLWIKTLSVTRTEY